MNSNQGKLNLLLFSNLDSLRVYLPNVDLDIFVSTHPKYISVKWYKSLRIKSLTPSRIPYLSLRCPEVPLEKLNIILDDIDTLVIRDALSQDSSWIIETVAGTNIRSLVVELLERTNLAN